jgi:addiction module RelB/DinJ family antitoxin
MNTSVVNVKVDKQVKKQAQEVAEDLGFSLSSLVNGFLRQLIRSKTVNFSMGFEPTTYLEELLLESGKQVKKGDVVSFSTADDAIKYVEKLSTSK